MERKIANNATDVHVGDNTSHSDGVQHFIKSKFLRWLLPPCILTFLTALIYHPSMYYPFQFDDIANISKRFGIRFDNPLARCWGSSRWFGDWLNSINFRIGRFEPFSYRFFNLIIHILAGLCVFYLIRELCLYMRKKSFFYNNADLIGFVTSGLFLLHPVQTQTVSYVIQARLEGLASLAVVATVLVYVKLVQAQSLMKKLFLGFLFFMTGMIACGTKELVVVLPALILLVDWFFISDQQWESFKKRFWLIALFTTLFGFIVVHHMGIKFVVDVLSFKMTTGNNRGNILTDGAFDIITPWNFFYSEFKVLVHYLMIFIWPFNISVEYDWKVAPNFFTFQVIVPGIILALIWAFIMRSAWNKKNTMVTFGLLWFFISMAPRATIIPSGELVCDYKTYLASVGIVTILAIGIVALFSILWSMIRNVPHNFYTRETQLGILSIIMLMVGVTAYERNKIWETSVAFWEDNAKKAPGKARVHNNLGVALSEAGRIDESIIAYKKAIDMDAHYADPLSNLAVAYSLKNDIDKAIEALRSAIHICPNYPEAYNNLGTLLLQKKQYEDAEQMLSIAIQLRPYYGKAYYNMARMHEEKEDHEKSWEFLKLATQGDLDTPEVIFKFGQMSLRIKKYQEAAAAFEQVLKLGVNQEQVWFNLANSYYMLDQHDRAMEIYEKLSQNNPLDAKYIYNLAEAHFNKKNYEKAYELFRKAGEVPRPIAQAFFRAAICLENMNKIDEATSFLQQLLSLNAAEDFKDMARSEIKRISMQHELQERVNAHGGNSIGLNELNDVIARHKGIPEKKNATKKA